MAALENGSTGLAFSSGMAAEDAIFRALLRPNTHVIVPNDMYGGTYRLLDKVLNTWDVSYTAVPIWDLDAVSHAIQPGRTRVVWCETPTNPLLGITDLAQLADLTHNAEAFLVVDNTLASPYLQRPLNFGADVVIHSSTKYLGGHSDVLGGALVAKTEELGETLRFHQNAMGGIPSPIDAWLILRGIKTLAVRIERQSATAGKIAEYLTRRPEVKEVFYPGLPTHPGHDIAVKQMDGFGGMVSFSLNGGEAAAIKACNNARLFTLAESLGAVESLICHPLRMTHASAAGSPAAPPANLVRLSVGIESPDDLMADLDRALDQIAAGG
jgi:cystathionine gamma-synthase